MYISKEEQIETVVSYQQPKKKSVMKRIWPLCLGGLLNLLINCIVFPLFVQSVPFAYLAKTQHKFENDTWNLAVLTA